MTQREIQDDWLNDADFAAANPINCTITGTATGVNKWNKEECQLILTLDNTLVKKISARGHNINNLIRAYGKEDNFWIGKRIQVHRFEDLNTHKPVTEIKAL